MEKLLFVSFVSYRNIIKSYQQLSIILYSVIPILSVFYLKKKLNYFKKDLKKTIVQILKTLLYIILHWIVDIAGGGYVGSWGGN